MSSERLLKRLRYWGQGQGDRITRVDAAEYTRSLLADIELLYNTRKGTVLIAEDMGLPDFTALLNRFGPQETTAMELSFRTVLDNYEPRVRNVTARFSPRDNEYGVLRFSVSCVVPFRDQSLSLEFNACVQGNGSVTVEA